MLGMWQRRVMLRVEFMVRSNRQAAVFYQQLEPGECLSRSEFENMTEACVLSSLCVSINNYMCYVYMEFDSYSSRLFRSFHHLVVFVTWRKCVCCHPWRCFQVGFTARH